MKKLIALILVFTLALASLSACGSKEPAAEETAAPAAAAPETEPAPAETTEPKPAAAYEIISAKAVTWVNNIGSPWVQTIIEVENTGSVNLYLNSCSYDLEDESGSLVAAHNYVNAYPQVLAPGEKGIIYNETTLDAPVDGELTVLPHEDIVEATVELVRLPVSDFSISDDRYLGVNMMGRVENNTGEEQALVYVVGIFYDADGNCIGSNFTIIDKIAAGDKVGFEASGFSLPESVTADSIASYEVYAYTNQFQF